MTDVLIIGGGPAGVTAALYTARAGLKTAILYKDHGALGKAAKIDNFYGHMEISGETLVNNGLQQAKNVGIDIINEEAVGITLNEDQTLTVGTAAAEYTTHAVVIATGASRATPQIKGLAELEGKGVSYCAICDGFFHKGKDVAVIGSSAYALHEVEDLLPIAKTVTLLTNGVEPLVKFPESVTVKTEKILEVTGQATMMGDVLGGVTLEGGEAIPLSGLFVAIGVAGGTALARKLGAVIENNAVTVDQQLRTTVPGVWAAGDCTGGLKQIVKASHEGAMAGMDIVKTLKERAK
ncbi:MAG: NAD(P)/FAD-dependent oxidoreductase [Defluviitaleaceae bacterium]|nr:NAD(P)/FAD-dependent oxidoreductase [Defluviitaleaceae bacterium]